jgi:hypothetical protein
MAYLELAKVVRDLEISHDQALLADTQCTQPQIFAMSTLVWAMQRTT